MKTPLQHYKDLIDGIVEISEGVLDRWILERGWPDLPENKSINDFLKALTPAQKQIVAQIARESREGGIHDTLVYLHDEVSAGDLRLLNNGLEIPVNTFESMNYDWLCRYKGDRWPDERSGGKRKDAKQ